MPNQPSKQITNWRAWPQWRVSVNYLEEITGYDFFSNLSNDIEEIIEDDASSDLILPLESASLLAVPEATFPLGNSSISPGIVTSIDSSIGHDRLVGVSSSGKIPVDNSSLKVGSNHAGLKDSAVLEIRPSEISPIQASQEKVGSFQISISENSSPQIGTIKVGSTQNSTFKIDTFKTNLHQINSTHINTTEISFPSSISLQQFLSSHNYTSQNTTVPTWLQFLQDSTPFNLNIQIDFPIPQLAIACWR